MEVVFCCWLLLFLDYNSGPSVPSWIWIFLLLRGLWLLVKLAHFLKKGLYGCCITFVRGHRASSGVRSCVAGGGMCSMWAWQWVWTKESVLCSLRSPGSCSGLSKRQRWACPMERSWVRAGWVLTGQPDSVCKVTCGHRGIHHWIFMEEKWGCLKRTGGFWQGCVGEEPVDPPGERGDNQGSDGAWSSFVLRNGGFLPPSYTL